MKTYKVKLNSIEKVKQFSDLIRNVNGEAKLSHNGHIIDAKSILGIFSLDLSQILTLKLDDKMPMELEAFLA